jgi:eukaryotic-like serine/threonine-protein kinase
MTCECTPGVELRVPWPTTVPTAVSPGVPHHGLRPRPRRDPPRPEVQHRYNAACAAGLAGCGQGKDDPPPDEAARADLRKQALGWLRAELASLGRSLDAGDPKLRASIARTLIHWKRDSDLAGVRDADGLSKLPEAERKLWQALWIDVDRLLERAGGTHL